jgi:lysozyme
LRALVVSRDPVSDGAIDLIALLVEHEGVRLKPYRDSVGRLTIGVGRNLDDVGIRYGEALELLKNDIDHIHAQLLSSFSWYKDLDQVRRDALIDMCFMGIGALSGFHKFLNYMELGLYEAASVEMLDSKWAKQVGKRATDLSYMIKMGLYPRLSPLTPV